MTSEFQSQPDFDPQRASGMTGVFHAAPAQDSPRGYSGVAWCVIILCCLFAIVGRMLLDSDEEHAGKDSLGIVLIEIQGRYMVGAANAQNMNSLIYSQAEKTLNVGSIDQRVRFIILANELMGPRVAAEKLTEIEQDIERAAAEDRTRPFELSAEHAQLLEALRTMYFNATPPSVDADAGETSGADAAPAAPNIDQLTTAQRQLLLDELRWFGKLALAPPGTQDQDARAAALRPALRLYYLFVSLIMVAGGVGLLGFIGLIVLIALWATGVIRGGIALTPVHHGIYAETFAVWMILFIALMLGAGSIASVVPQMGMFITVAAFFSSLLALAWPLIRGATWRQVRHDIGWHFGQAKALEPAVGIGGYIMGLPVLALGLAVTLVLVQIKDRFKVPAPLFDPQTGPAHPIIAELGSNNWLILISVLLTGVIAAPIVEETMFRGVLYRHLRDASRTWGNVLSVAVGALVNSFVFAIIHPQGWVAVPALMSLAIMFTIVREWRGSLIPSMVMHGISNFIVLSLLIGILRLN